MKEVTDTALRLSKLLKDEVFVVEPAVTPFSKEHPLPMVSQRFSPELSILYFLY